MPLRRGEIYWVQDCPPLLGTHPAPHRVIVVNRTAQLADSSTPVHGVVISSSISDPGCDHIPMPNKQQNPNCTTGLTKPCWAVSSWILRITDRSKLGNRSGFIGGKTLEKVVVAYAEAIANGVQPIPHPPERAS